MERWPLVNGGNMNTKLSSIGISLFIFANSLAIGAPAGFTDAKLLKKIMNGSIVVTTVNDSSTEYRTYVRAFFDKVSPDAYVDLYTSHKDWIGLLPELKDAKTVSANADRTQFEYSLYLKVRYFGLPFDVYPEGRQTVTRGADALSEWKVHNLITNYQSDIKLGEEHLRLIPYQGGILVENEVHVAIHQSTIVSRVVKGELQKKFVTLVGKIRTRLTGK
jgi:hypothetical protein